MIYLLHFERKLHHAQHYLGYANNLDARIEHHRNGTGARLTQVIRAAGISFVLARTWQGGREFERQLKNQKHAPRLCPICNPRKDNTHE